MSHPGTGETVKLVSNPVRYDGKAAPVRLPPQRLGAQTAEILGELGLSDAEQQALVENGAVGMA